MWKFKYLLPEALPNTLRTGSLYSLTDDSMNKFYCEPAIIPTLC